MRRILCVDHKNKSDDEQRVDCQCLIWRHSLLYIHGWTIRLQCTETYIPKIIIIQYMSYHISIIDVFSWNEIQYKVTLPYNRIARGHWNNHRHSEAIKYIINHITRWRLAYQFVIQSHTSDRYFLLSILAFFNFWCQHSLLKTHTQLQCDHFSLTIVGFYVLFFCFFLSALEMHSQ